MLLAICDPEYLYYGLIININAIENAKLFIKIYGNMHAYGRK